MSNTSKLIVAFWVGVLIVLSFQRLTTDRQKVIDMPEEINEAVSGDTLTVYKVNADTVFIGFNNLRNR